MKQPRQIALLGDTHGHLDPRINAVAGGCDSVVHTGDVGGAAILQALGWPSPTVGVVRGNNDTHRHWRSDAPETIETLPEALTWTLPGGTLVAVHGHRLRAHDRHRQLRRYYSAADIVVYGHSHRLYVDTADLPWVVNPGAAGRTRTYGGPTCLVLSVATHGWALTEHRFEPASRSRRTGQGRRR